jgi:hypothetical protein
MTSIRARDGAPATEVDHRDHARPGDPTIPAFRASNVPRSIEGRAPAGAT